MQFTWCSMWNKNYDIWDRLAVINQRFRRQVVGGDGYSKPLLKKSIIFIETTAAWYTE